MKKHKNALDVRPAHALAFHAQRGVREHRGELKHGWRWLTDAEAERYFADGVVPVTRPLPKPGVHHRAPGGAWRKWRGPVRPVE